MISQTQDVHEEIADLLEQLRRNQDLQVTIEVRFITLNDNFFERIGVDFQFNVVNNTPPHEPHWKSLRECCVKSSVCKPWPATPPAAVPRTYAPNLELPFRQDSFNLATPQFGQPVDVASFGFAILSDIEAYLLSTPPRATAAATCCKPPRSRCSTASWPRSSTRRRRRS